MKLSTAPWLSSGTEVMLEQKGRWWGSTCLYRETVWIEGQVGVLFQISGEHVRGGPPRISV